MFRWRALEYGSWTKFEPNPAEEVHQVPQESWGARLSTVHPQLYRKQCRWTSWGAYPLEFVVVALRWYLPNATFFGTRMIRSQSHVPCQEKQIPWGPQMSWLSLATNNWFFVSDNLQWHLKSRPHHEFQPHDPTVWDLTYYLSIYKKQQLTLFFLWPCRIRKTEGNNGENGKVPVD